MKISIQYCVRWNYLPEATRLAAAIQQAKGVLPTLIKGKDGVFDVSVDGRLIYSKDQTGRFPEPAEILARLP